MKTRIIALIFLALFLVYACKQGSSDKLAGQNKSSLSSEEKERYLKKGKELAGLTFAALSGNLQKALQKGGVAEAVRYCNLVADPLVDSLSRAHQAQISRTSNKPRNPNNSPDEQEKEILREYQQKMENGKVPEPQIRLVGANNIRFYAPIHIMPLCQKCHGVVGETTEESDYAVIKELYPSDQAVGYKPGDLRGLWSIQFKK